MTKIKKQEPKKLDSESDRSYARAVRESQWEFTEKCAKHDPLWFCVWNKERRPELDGEWRDGLLAGMEILDWIEMHKQWFKVGRWSTKRYARPVRLTEAGREALQHKDLYDMDPVHYGMVEPGCVSIPQPVISA